jgi:peptide deformylase
MSLKQIRVLGDPVLREKAHKVHQFTDSLQELVEDMVETMRRYNGVGLAAPQVGITERVIVVETPEDEEEPGSGALYTVINPELARTSKDLVDGVEGCLSIPGFVGEVSRHGEVTVKGQNPQGQKIRIKAEGFLARVFQHEIDHLDGVLFIDKLTEPDRIWRVEEGDEEQTEARGDVSALVAADPRIQEAAQV